MDAATIPLLAKRKYVAGLSEDDFRDKLVRPLFLRKGFSHGAELCGPTEAGKDCFFRVPAPFGDEHIVVLQTKIGNLNMGGEPSKNVEKAATQLHTAMKAMVLEAKQNGSENRISGIFVLAARSMSRPKRTLSIPFRIPISSS